MGAGKIREGGMGRRVKKTKAPIFGLKHYILYARERKTLYMVNPSLGILIRSVKRSYKNRLGKHPGLVDR